MLDVPSFYVDAATAGFRKIDIAARLRTPPGAIIATPDQFNVIDCEVTIDWSSRYNAPIWSNRIAFVDPDGELLASVEDGDDNLMWFNRKFDIRYGMDCSQFGGPTMHYEPAFRGWVQDINRTGAVVEVLSMGKEVRHLAEFDHPFTRSFEADKGEKIKSVIQRVIDNRGIDDDLFGEGFTILGTDEELERSYHQTLGNSPWEFCQRMANDIDKQLYFDNAGRIQLRDRPGPTELHMDFTIGANGIMTVPPRNRLALRGFLNTVYVKSDWIRNDGPNQAERPEPVVGFAQLPASSSLSKETLGNFKPITGIYEVDNIRTFVRANAEADRRLARRSSGLTEDNEVSCLPLIFLEPLDVYRAVNRDGQVFKAHLRRSTANLMHDGLQVINHTRRRRPDGKNRKRFGRRRGRRPRQRERRYRVRTA